MNLRLAGKEIARGCVAQQMAAGLERAYCRAVAALIAIEGVDMVAAWRWAPVLDRRSRHHFATGGFVRGGEMERRIMEGGYNCAGEYRLARARPAQWPDDVAVDTPRKLPRRP